MKSTDMEVFRHTLAGVAVALGVFTLSLCGCTPASSSSQADVQIALDFDPSPPQVGEASVVLAVSDSAGNPVTGGTIELEGNMNHAGMKPVFAKLKESDPGKYEGRLNFTMGGDWFVLVTGESSDGQSFNEKIDVPGVKAP